MTQMTSRVMIMATSHTMAVNQPMLQQNLKWKSYQCEIHSQAYATR